MVKTTQKSDLPWSAIFSVMAYGNPPNDWSYGSAKKSPQISLKQEEKCTQKIE